MDILMANRRSRTGKPAQAVEVLVGLLDTGGALPYPLWGPRSTGYHVHQADGQSLLISAMGRVLGGGCRVCG